MKQHTPARISLRCSCGGAVSGAITAGNPEQRFRAIWERVHSGPGHETEDRSRLPDFTAALAKEARP